MQILTKEDYEFLEKIKVQMDSEEDKMKLCEIVAKIVIAEM